MQALANDLADVLISRLATTPKDARLLVGICGIPASGKSTLAALILERVNQRLAALQTLDEAVLVGLDGWHLSRAELDAMPDPKLAHDRRGIHWTFDANSYVSFMRALRKPLLDATDITAPSFDHALKDPTPHAVTIAPRHRLVLIEGLYTLLSVPPWSEAGRLFDERWYIELDVEEASRRLVKRHVATGIAKDLTEAQWRSDENDMPNGRFIVANMLQPTRVIPGIKDPTFSM